MDCKEEYDKQNNYSEQKSEMKLKPQRNVMRIYREVIGMADMPTPPDSPSLNLTRESNRI